MALAPAGRARVASDRVRRSANPSPASRERRNQSDLTCTRYSRGKNLDWRSTYAFFNHPVLTGQSRRGIGRRSRRCRRRRHRSAGRTRACRRSVRRPCRAGCPAGSGCEGSVATRLLIRDANHLRILKKKSLEPMRRSRRPRLCRRCPLPVVARASASRHAGTHLLSAKAVRERARLAGGGDRVACLNARGCAMEVECEQAGDGQAAVRRGAHQSVSSMSKLSSNCSLRCAAATRGRLGHLLVGKSLAPG